jgi:hypothetical protein
MGIFHSRASKRRDRQAARLLREERLALHHARTAEAERESAGQPWWRQPSIGAALREMRGGEAYARDTQRK